MSGTDTPFHLHHVERTPGGVIVVCSCGWTSRPARLASKAVADWKKHKAATP